MSELAILETLNPVDVFASDEKAQDILSQIEKDARAAAALLDVTEESGRKEMKSLAYKVSRSKTAIDEAGKKLQADAKAVVDRVNAGRRVASERLDALRDEVKGPVKEFEDREAARVQKHRDMIATIEHLGRSTAGMNKDDLEHHLESLDIFMIGDFEEFKNRAELAVDQTRNALKAAIIIAEKEEADRKEAERLAAIAAEEARIAAEEARKAREERIAKEAAEKAKAEAEAKAERDRQAAAEALERERQAAARAEKEAQDRIEKMRLAAIEEERRTEAARIKAERAAQENIARVQREADERAARIEAERAAAIEKERQRIADEKAAQEAEDARRAANKAHRGKINREVLAALMELGLSEEQGKAIIGAILGGSVPHVTIGY